MEKLTYPLPRLKAGNQALFDLYHNNIMIDTTDISKTFGVSGNTAIRVVLKVKEAIKEDNAEYIVPKAHIVPVKQLFRLYGWDIKQINSSVKALQKGEKI